MRAASSDTHTVELSWDWRQLAACRGEDPELFFPVASDGPAFQAQVMAAKAVCRRCPVRGNCLSEALRGMPHGIAGGLTEQERRGMRPASALATPRSHALLAEGRPHPEIARLCGVSVRTVERWAARLRADGGGTAGRGGAR